MSIKECHKVADWFAKRPDKANKLISEYKCRSLISDWDFSILDVVISFGHVLNWTVQDMIKVTS